MKALLALEDGRTFPCRSFTGTGEASGEVVFNTGMTGYQEVLTDASYRGQMVTMTYPLIGNYGVNPEDIESDRIQVSAFIVKEYQDYPSNYRSTETLAEYLKRYRVLGIDNSGRWLWLLEANGAVALAPEFGSGPQSPALGTVAVRYAVDDVAVTTGIQLPLNDAVGVPLIRGVVALGWAPRFV